MSGSVIVLVTDLDDPKHGEITVIESPLKAARLVETLLEAGFAQERIRVFNGTEMAAQVTYRPVVSLTADADDSSSPTADEAKESGKGDDDRTEGEAGTEEPGVKDGVKFSSLFRSS